MDELEKATYEFAGMTFDFCIVMIVATVIFCKFYVYPQSLIPQCNFTKMSF